MPRPCRVLALQHVACEHPGVFRDFLAADGHELVQVELDENEPIPDVDDFDAMLVMGGPMDVWQEDELPWLKDEKAAIRRFVAELDRPFLGFCLGHQLLASALGGEVGPSRASEIGIMPVSLTEDGAGHPAFAGFPEAFEVLQWHSSEVTVPPAGATLLASSPVTGNQAMAIGDRALSVQFHLEITATTVSDWAALPGYQKALTEVFGADGPAALEKDAAARMAAFNAGARRLYDNWCARSGFAKP